MNTITRKSVLSLILILPFLAGIQSQELKASNKKAGIQSVELKSSNELAGIKSDEYKVDQEKSSTKSDESEIDKNVSNSGSEKYIIDQKNKAFSRTSITVGVGDKISFVNSDSYFHNVYSLSDTAQFDLGSYPKGESRTITLEKPGEVVARCAIHPQMELSITVEEK